MKSTFGQPETRKKIELWFETSFYSASHSCLLWIENSAKDFDENLVNIDYIIEGDECNLFQKS